MENNVPLWPLKAHYFLMGSGSAPIVPFLPIIGKQMGIPGSGLGLVLALAQMSGLVIRPTLGSLMDKYPSKKRTFLQLLILFGMLSMNFLNLTHPIDIYDKSLNVTRCDKSGQKIQLSLGKRPDSCLKHKLQTLYDFENECELNCAKAKAVKGHFVGSSAKVKEDVLTFDLENVVEKPCFEGDLCSLKCDKEELNRGKIMSLVILQV